jgi:C4-dicarboxylate-specific signal transduction histidine kinase
LADVVHGGAPMRQRLVEVTDTGAGISPDALGQVFEPFYTTKPVGQGTGLGLAISRDIIRDHGGTIVAQSRPGQGQPSSGSPSTRRWRDRPARS